MTEHEKLVERVSAVVREQIKVDASGLAPSVISHFVYGHEEAARAILALVAETLKEPTPGMRLAMGMEMAAHMLRKPEPGEAVEDIWASGLAASPLTPPPEEKQNADQSR